MLALVEVDFGFLDTNYEGLSRVIPNIKRSRNSKEIINTFDRVFKGVSVPSWLLINVKL